MTQAEIERLTIEDRADYIIWCGDLNYRLEMCRFEAQLASRNMHFEVKLHQIILQTANFLLETD
jgi:endonuclease/exonuclease/phosphatase family metal-dependent hydrolase